MVTPTRHNARVADVAVLAMAAITATDALVKALLEEIKHSQFILVRALVILGIALVLNNQRILLPILRQPWPLVRGSCELPSTSLWLFGLQFIALPTAAALAWTSPIIVALLGIIILREANSLWRWISVLVGFIEALCVTCPWGLEWSLLLLPVATAAASALREISTHFIEPSAHPLQIAFITVLVVAVGAGIVSVFEWQSFGWRMAGGISVSALLVGAAFPLIIMAVRLGEITFIAPFFFTLIPFAVILGYLFWGGTLNGLATLGVIAIIADGWLTAQKTRRRPSPE